MLLVQDNKLREDLMVAVHIVNILEEFRYGILVVYQKGSFMEILGKVH